MQEYEFQHMLLTVPGIGVKAQSRYGETLCYFYEDFERSRGIDRAMVQTYNALKKGTIVSAVFIENHRKANTGRKGE